MTTRKTSRASKRAQGSASRAPKRSRGRRPTHERSIWQELVAIGRRIPKADQEKFPENFARDIDDYLEGRKAF